jgi:hypothetical protein
MTEQAIESTTTVEVTTPEAPAAPAPKATRAQVEAEGWTPAEIEKGEKMGLLEKPAGQAPAAPAAAAKPGEAPAAGMPAPAAKEEPAPAPKPGAPKAAGIPGVDDGELTPEQEKFLLETFPQGHPQRAMYFRQKSERRARQAAEARAREIEAENALLKAQLAGKTQTPAAEPGEDDENAPLTKKALKDWERQKQEEAAQQHRAAQQRHAAVTSAQREHEEYAKTVFADFDDTVGLAEQVIKTLVTQPEALFPEQYRRDRAMTLLRELHAAAAEADKHPLDGRNAAFIAYEIGQMHPQYGKPKAPAADGTPKDGLPQEKPTAPGSQKPETVKRIEQNTQRRPSSASVPGGGGKRVIAAEDVTEKDFLGWDYAQRAAFKQQHPDQYARLMRG